MIVDSEHTYASSFDELTLMEVQGVLPAVDPENNDYPTEPMPMKEAQAITDKVQAGIDEREQQRQERIKTEAAKQRLVDLGIFSLLAQEKAALIKLATELGYTLEFPEETVQQDLIEKAKQDQTSDESFKVKCILTIKQFFKRQVALLFGQAIAKEELIEVIKTDEDVKRQVNSLLESIQEAIPSDPQQENNWEKVQQILEKVRLTKTVINLEKLIQKKHGDSHIAVPLPAEKMHRAHSNVTIKISAKTIIETELLKVTKEEVGFIITVQTQQEKDLDVPVTNINILDARDFVVQNTDHVQHERYEGKPGEIEIHTHHENLPKRYHHTISVEDILEAVNSPCWISPETEKAILHQYIFGVVTVEKRGNRLTGKKRKMTLQLYLIDLKRIRQKMDNHEDLGLSFGVVKFGNPIVMDQS